MIRPCLLSAAIADDEAAARGHLSALLAACGVRILAECSTGNDVLAAIARMRPDLVCLDVRMPNTDGMDVARALSGRPRPAVVFTTGYPD
ncbi:MAG: LytR/AlgR family response regulator transcription factor, partial [bacterium]